MAAERNFRTIPPGELTADDVGAPQAPRPISATERLDIDPWASRLLGLADYVIDKVKESPGTGGGGGRWLGVAVAGMYILYALGAGVFGAHLVADGTVRAKASRTECLVEWLVERAAAEDRGEPPPPFSPLTCRE